MDGGSIFQAGTNGGQYDNNHMYRTGDKKYVGFPLRTHREVGIAVSCQVGW